MDYVLGIDVGTTGTKSALFTGVGELVDIDYTSYSTEYPDEGLAEQNPRDWWDGLMKTTGAVVRRNGVGRRVRALSLSTQGGCLVLLDKDYNPVGPAVSWMDKRAGEISEKLERRISMEELYHLCGWPVLDSLNFPTIMWFREKMPESLRGVKFFASTIDYLNYLLTGKFSIDYTNLALTGFLDMSGKCYSDQTMHIAGLAPDNLPAIVPSGDVIARLSAVSAEKLGLAENVLVVSGAHDRYCESIGTGSVKSGDCVLGAGTSWVLLATTGELLFHETSSEERGFVKSLFPGLHPVKQKYGLMTVVPHGGNSLKWFREVLRPEYSFDQLNEEASRVRPGSGDLLFIPVSSSTSGKGSFQGIDGIHRIGHFCRAVFEGVAFVNRIHFDLFRQAGLKIRKLTMIGGGAKSGLWPQIVADMCNVTVELPMRQEAACAGAAVLAAHGSDMFPSIEEGSACFRGKSCQVHPFEKNVPLYHERYTAFLDFLKRA
jgi:xylulokinase